MPICKQCGKAFNHSNPKKSTCSSYCDKGRHGLDSLEILQIAIVQNWECPISGLPLDFHAGEVFDSTTGKRIQIDHCHKTGVIRGLVVQKINWLLDQFEAGSYGKLLEPIDITKYKENPPAIRALGFPRLYK